MMGFLLQITMSCLCALSRQVGRCWCCELAVHMVETECRCWVPGAGVGAVSWLSAWWRQGASAGAGCWLCRWWRHGAGCWVLGAGCRCWCVETGCRCRCWVLAVRVVDTGYRRRVPVLGAGCAGLVRCRDRVPVPVSQGAATSREAERISNQNTMQICGLRPGGSTHLRICGAASDGGSEMSTEVSPYMAICI